jgi:glycosyltransferase involved in cell wall biosynthesis
MQGRKRIRSIGSDGLGLPEDATIVSLSPFPPNGEWGGAIRSKEISKAIKQVFPKSYTLHVHQLYVTQEEMPKFLVGSHPQLDDIRMLYKNFHSDLYIDGVPDAVIFDHPWLWEEAKRLKERYPDIKIIHSSHNLEWTLKRDLLNGLDSNQIDTVVDFLEDVESEIANLCDLIICVKEDEANWFRQQGADNVIVANNGTNTVPRSPKSEKPYALVVGSGHPPNVEGSLEYLFNAVNWLPNGTDLMFVGSMCGALSGNLGKERNNKRNTSIMFLGIRSDDDLIKLIESASVILLPIPYGGGSNLKTAEALSSGRPIVSTTKAFRGFEEFINSENVYVSDDLPSFREMTMMYCISKQDSIMRKGIENLSWNKSLKPIRVYLGGE